MTVVVICLSVTTAGHGHAIHQPIAVLESGSVSRRSKLTELERVSDVAGRHIRKTSGLSPLSLRPAALSNIAPQDDSVFSVAQFRAKLGATS